jgi:hypothetical protein
VAESKDRDGVSAATLYSVVGQVFVTMSLVLAVAGRPESDWFRVFVMFLVAGLALLYGGASLWLRFRKKTPSGPAV